MAMSRKIWREAPGREISENALAAIIKSEPIIRDSHALSFRSFPGRPQFRIENSQPLRRKPRAGIRGDISYATQQFPTFITEHSCGCCHSGCIALEKFCIRVVIAVPGFNKVPCIKDPIGNDQLIMRRPLPEKSLLCHEARQELSERLHSNPVTPIASDSNSAHDQGAGIIENMVVRAALTIVLKVPANPFHGFLNKRPQVLDLGHDVFVLLANTCQPNQQVSHTLTRRIRLPCFFIPVLIQCDPRTYDGQ